MAALQQHAVQIHSVLSMWTVHDQGGDNVTLSAGWPMAACASSLWYILWALPPSSSWCSDERRWDRGCAIKPFVRPEIFYRQQEAWWARTSPLFLSKIENICVRGGPELAEGEGEGGLSARCSLNHRRLAPPLVSRRRRLSVDLRILSEAKSTGRGRGKEPFFDYPALLGRVC